MGLVTLQTVVLLLHVVPVLSEVVTVTVQALVVAEVHIVLDAHLLCYLRCSFLRIVHLS